MNTRQDQMSSLATQIQESVNSRFELAAVDQPEKVVFCNGPQQVIDYFFRALDGYPPQVFRLPYTVILLEIFGLPKDSKSQKRSTNRVVKQIAKVLRGAVSAKDVVVRCGFNRFALLLPGLDEVAAGKICQRIKAAIHHLVYFRLKRNEQIEVEFAMSQHKPCEGEDLVELIFSNERTIRLARALGDGAIVSRTEAKEGFHSHHNFSFQLGESFDSTILRSGEDDQ